VPDNSPFAHHHFRLLLLGQTTSQLGAQVSTVAIPLLAVLTLHASALQMGMVNASSTVAFALIGLPAGAWIDRWHKRRVLIGSDIARAVLLSTIPLAWLFGVLAIPQLIVVSLLAGVARVFFDVGYQSFIPTVVGKDGVLAGNAAMETVRATGQVIGPGIGGWLVAVISAANVVLVQAGTFAVSALSLIAIGSREPASARHREHPQLRREIGAGVRFVLGNPVLRAITLTSAVGNFAFAIASAVSMIFLAHTLGLGAFVIGNLLALGSVTAVAGAASTPRLARRLGSARVIWLPLVLTGPFTVLSALARPGPLLVLVVIGTAAGEFGQIVYAITNVSLRQRLCPANMLGRVNATMRFLIMGLLPLGAVLGGTLGELLGLRATLVLAFGLVLLSPLPTWRALRHIRDVEEIPAWEGIPSR
jgi:MFS family permease